MRHCGRVGRHRTRCRTGQGRSCRAVAGGTRRPARPVRCADAEAGPWRAGGNTGRFACVAGRSPPPCAGSTGPGPGPAPGASALRWMRGVVWITAPPSLRAASWKPLPQRGVHCATRTGHRQGDGVGVRPPAGCAERRDLTDADVPTPQPSLGDGQGAADRLHREVLRPGRGSGGATAPPPSRAITGHGRIAFSRARMAGSVPASWDFPHCRRRAARGQAATGRRPGGPMCGCTRPPRVTSCRRSRAPAGWTTGARARRRRRRGRPRRPRARSRRPGRGRGRGSPRSRCGDHPSPTGGHWGP